MMFTYKKNQNGFRSYLHFYLSCCVLFYCLLLNNVIAETLENGQTAPIERTYSISAGSLQDALILFAQQSGIDLIYDPVLLEDIRTQGLDGKFDASSGLNFLLIGSGLQFVQQPDGFEIIASQPAGGLEISGAQSGEKVTVLPTIEISASNTGSYAATSSVTATKTNTLLRDVPQSITVVTEELIKDLK